LRSPDLDSDEPSRHGAASIVETWSADQISSQISNQNNRRRK